MKEFELLRKNFSQTGNFGAQPVSGRARRPTSSGGRAPRTLARPPRLSAWRERACEEDGEQTARSTSQLQPRWSCCPPAAREAESAALFLLQAESSLC